MFGYGAVYVCAGSLRIHPLHHEPQLNPEDFLHFVELDEFLDDTIREKRAMASVGRRMVERLKRFAEDLETADSIPERFTCRTVKLNLEPTPYSPEQVKAARETLRASQAIFAHFLGVSPSAVRDWEQGASPPRGSACRIMDEILRDPDYWRARLRELAIPVKAE